MGSHTLNDPYTVHYQWNHCPTAAPCREIYNQLVHGTAGERGSLSSKCTDRTPEGEVAKGYAGPISSCPERAPHVEKELQHIVKALDACGWAKSGSWVGLGCRWNKSA